MAMKNSTSNSWKMHVNIIIFNSHFSGNLEEDDDVVELSNDDKLSDDDEDSMGPTTVEGPLIVKESPKDEDKEAGKLINY